MLCNSVKFPLPDEIKCDCSTCKMVKEKIRRLVVKERLSPGTTTLKEILDLRKELCEWQRANR